MNHKRPMRPSSGHDANMYDDEPWANEYERRSSPQGYHNAPKDHSRAPLRGPAGENMYASTSAGRNYNSEGRSRRDERSRSPRREGRSRYTDRDREDYQSPARRSRSRSRSRSPYFGGPPSRTIILEGLSLEMTQEDLLGFWLSIGFGRFGHRFGIQISNELQHSLRVEGLEEVRLIRDKKTGLSRQFAFAQFASLHEARRFLDRHFPTISLYGAYDPSQATDSEPTKVRVSFSREKDERDKPGKSEDDWKCEVCYLANYSYRALCFRCNAPRMRATAQGVVVAQTNMSSFSGFATTGDSDASPDSTASQFILLRGLEPGVTEELLAKGVSKLYKTKVGTPSTDFQPPKKTKISSTSNDGSLGAKVGSLRRVLLIRDRKTNDSWRYGFAEFSSVEDAQAAMTKYKASEKFTISSKPVLLSYIHAGVFVPVLHVVDAELAQFTFSPLSNPSVKLMYWDEAAYASEYVTASTAPTSTVNNEKESKHARLAAAAANEGLLTVGKEGEPKAKKRKVEKDAPPGSKKVVAPHLQFWTNRHAELHGIVPKDDESAASGPVSAPKKGAVLDDSPPAQSFADLERKCCLLCSRQFKAESEIHKHERISQLHRDNMKNEELVAKAMAKLTKSNETGTDNSAYRDRAKERRQAFNQPKQPAAQHHRTPKDAETDSNQNKDAEKPAPVPSKGAALLGKMGWTAGEGLGAQGTGRTEAIATELYSQGVGLGAQGGKVGDAVDEAQRQTKGSYAEFLSKTKDKAKERFESLG